MKQERELLAILLLLTTCISTSFICSCSNDDAIAYEKPLRNADAELSCPNNHHPHAIDLNLPSGTIWSCCNIGANSPEEYGNYFAWGETSKKRNYKWSTYKWMNKGESDWSQINKYTSADIYRNACWYSNGIFVGDNKTELDPEDDAATVNWGRGWQMPSLFQLEELINSRNTLIEWVKVNGVKGILIKSINIDHPQSIFLPAAGCCNYTSIDNAGISGGYWSRSLTKDCSYSGRRLLFGPMGIMAYYSYRFYGRSVRPVVVQQE